MNNQRIIKIPENSKQFEIKQLRRRESFTEKEISINEIEQN
jgi:hypothetical protein